MVETDQLLSRPEVARILGVSENTITNLEAAGFLERVPLAKVKVVRFRASDVRRVIRRRREATPDAHGFMMTEIPEGEGSARNQGESLAELDREAQLIREQAKVLPPNGEVNSDDA